MDTKEKKYIATYGEDESCIRHKINLDSSSFITMETKYHINGTEKEISRFHNLICNIRSRYDENGDCIHVYLNDSLMPKPFEYDARAMRLTPTVGHVKSGTSLKRIK